MKEFKNAIQDAIQEITNELELIKKLRLIEVSDYELTTKNHPIFKKILHYIVKRLEVSIVSEASKNASINILFKQSSKIYQLSMHFGSKKDDSIFLVVSYVSPEHTSLNCNRYDETIGELMLNDKSEDEVVQWILSLQGKTKCIYCHYCGEITIQY
jgi:hypothetical protein